ncbi:MAG: hypothetical protein JWN67_3021 [Actinomycetia bacterium]|nr:hypothetical protein [Actinomycetes bacterium]
MTELDDNPITEKVSEVADRYRHGHDRPLGPYGVLDVVYVGLVGLLGLAARRRRTALPELSPRDIALVGAATHRLARTIAKDPITSPIRMPFTTYAGTSGPAELHEEVVAEGFGHAIGELVTCPFCLSQWVATGFVAGLVFAPRATRLVAATFAGVALSDFLQYAYAGAQRVEG